MNSLPSSPATGPPAGRCLVIDGGGSGTRTAYVRGTEVSDVAHAATINPFAAGRAESELADLLVSAGRHEQDLDCVWIASAGVPWAVGDEHRDLAAALRNSGPRARRWVLSNDALLPLASVRGDAHPVVILAGTGSCVVAPDPSGSVVRLGGREYLLSDDGSSYAIGLAGLRLALHRVEGGRSDDLAGSLTAEVGGTLTTKAREITRSSRRKQLIAGVARTVLAAVPNDAELRESVRPTISRLARHALEAASRTGSGSASFWLFGGLSDNAAYTRMLEAELCSQANDVVSLTPLALDWAAAARAASDPTPPRWLADHAYIVGGQP